MYKYLMTTEPKDFEDNFVEWFRCQNLNRSEYQELLQDIKVYCERWKPYLFRRPKTIEITYNPKREKVMVGYHSYSNLIKTKKLKNGKAVAEINCGYEMSSAQYRRFKAGLYKVLNEYRKDKDYRLTLPIDRIFIEGQGQLPNIQYNRVKPRARRSVDLRIPFIGRSYGEVYDDIAQDVAQIESIFI